METSMSQEEVLMMVAAFGPITATDMRKAIKCGNNRIHCPLRVLEASGEIRALEQYGRKRCGAGNAALWVAV
jgi:hypothetical protein